MIIIILIIITFNSLPALVVILVLGINKTLFFVLELSTPLIRKSFVASIITSASLSSGFSARRWSILSISVVVRSERDKVLGIKGWKGTQKDNSVVVLGHGTSTS